MPRCNCKHFTLPNQLHYQLACTEGALYKLLIIHPMGYFCQTVVFVQSFKSSSNDLYRFFC